MWLASHHVFVLCALAVFLYVCSHLNDSQRAPFSRNPSLLRFVPLLHLRACPPLFSTAHISARRFKNRKESVASVNPTSSRPSTLWQSEKINARDILPYSAPITKIKARDFFGAVRRATHVVLQVATDHPKRRQGDRETGGQEGQSQNTLTGTVIRRSDGIARYSPCLAFLACQAAWQNCFFFSFPTPG